MPAYKYDVALSFAGEDRPQAEALAMALLSRGIRPFYDEFEKHNLWGKDLIEFLHEVYSKQARYCIILISKHYVAKGWPTHERKSAQERAFVQGGEYILPIRLDDTPVPGLPETIGYIKFDDYTVNELGNLFLKKLGYPLSDTTPVEIASKAKPRETDFDPLLDHRFLRHEKFAAKLLPLKNQYGYFGLHSFIVPEIRVSDERLKDTFLNIGRNYSQFLSYASLPGVHPDGYSRRYEIHRESNERLITEVATCYFDGHIVTEGYLDIFCEGDNGFNPNWFIYEIQRHLQLTKEVFEGFTARAICAVMLQDITKFQWEIYRSGSVWQKKSYVGYHKNIVLPIQLSEIHGREKWNVKIKIAEDIMINIARMFGMDRLPQPYWNTAEELDYGIPGR
ncbi:MAG: TIR domain-containing protein [Chloroflexi bacterium]|nr:TIR domain-containing protein [Chloroflexota bacterium]